MAGATHMVRRPPLLIINSVFFILQYAHSILHINVSSCCSRRGHELEGLASKSKVRWQGGRGFLLKLASHLLICSRSCVLPLWLISSAVGMLWLGVALLLAWQLLNLLLEWSHDLRVCLLKLLEDLLAMLCLLKLPRELEHSLKDQSSQLLAFSHRDNLLKDYKNVDSFIGLP